MQIQWQCVGELQRGYRIQITFELDKGIYKLLVEKRKVKYITMVQIILHISTDCTENG